MSQITAADITKLRRMTGAGMMDCKKALEETNGDFDKAVEAIRKKGKAIANKRADREASEGVVLAKTTADNKRGIMIVLNCETDFVARNEQFVEFADSILTFALEQNPANLDALKQIKQGSVTIAENIEERIAAIGEKIDLTYFEKIEAPFVITYIHPGNQLASMVGFNKDNVELQVAKDIAMQIAAMNPVSIDKDDVPQSVIDQEIEIGKEQARREGKPEEMLEKIALGKINKFYKENTLLNQEFVKDNKLSVRDYLANTDKELKITAFKRFSLKL